MPVISPSALAERRQRIVDAARTCVERDGPDGLTTRAVTAEAGISTGALYHHFAGLDALRAELAEQQVVAGIAEVAARARPGEDPLSWALRALVCAPPIGAVRGSGTPGATGAERVVKATLDEVLLAADAVDGLRSDVDREALSELLELVWEGIDRRSSVGLRTGHERLANVLEVLLDGGVRRPTNG